MEPFLKSQIVAMSKIADHVAMLVYNNCLVSDVGCRFTSVFVQACAIADHYAAR